jgi:hypothetical protein
MWLDILFGYFLFCLGTGIMCAISLWPSMRGYILADSPFLREETHKLGYYITWFIVGFIFAPYLFWETLFGPSYSLTEKILTVFLDTQN